FRNRRAKAESPGEHRSSPCPEDPMRHATLILVILACASCSGSVAADELRRRADFGASFAPPASGNPARILRFRPGSVLEAAGARVGDEIVAGPDDFG